MVIEGLMLDIYSRFLKLFFLLCLVHMSGWCTVMSPVYIMNDSVLIFVNLF